MAKIVDLTGQRFGKLTVIKRGEDKISPNGDKKLAWVCKCDCGNEIIVRGTNLKSGTTKSCGCALIKDLTGQKFGRLTVISRAENYIQPNGKNVTMWNCECKCGNKVTVRGSQLVSGSTKSCGCYHRDVSRKCNNHRIKDISGVKFGKLTAIKRVGYNNGYIWECKCDCGNTTNVSLANLNSGHIRSCGCLNKGIKRNLKHGQSRNRIYKEYYGMIERCKENAERYKKDYFERGITVCPEWLGKDGFQNFYDWAMANGYCDNLTLDRIDNDKGYSPENCRWATMKEQGNNRRNNLLITRNGKTQTLTEWSEELNVPAWKARNILLNEK